MSHMAISKKKKEKIYADLLDGFKNASGVSFTKNTGLTVEDISNIRADLREADGKMMLAKKTIIKLAFKEVHGVELSDEMLDGQIAVVFAQGEDAVAPMGAVGKNMKDLNTKEGDKIVFQGAYFEGKIQDAATTTKLASLPSRDVLLAKMMGSMLSPVSGLARFFDGAKNKLEEISGKTVTDLIQESEAQTETTSEAPKAEAPVTESAATETSD